MREWGKVRFSEAVSFVSDKTDVAFADIEHYISTENMLPDFGGVRLAAGLPPAGSVSIFHEGDTLFSNIRTYFRKVWRARFEGHCSNDVLVLRPKNAAMLLPEYLCYCCQSDEFIELSVRTAKGAKMPRGDKQALAAYEFFLPPLPEQRAIAHILGTLDDKIELNRRQSETLQEMARALFKAWFVDFEPVRAKMSGRWQRGQTLPGLPAHLYDLFPDRLVETEHGEVPQGWTCTPFGNLLESTIGGDWGKESLDGNYSEIVSIIRGTDFPDIVSGVVGKVPVRYTTLKRLNARELRSGDIVVEISGGSPKQPTGRSLYISDDVLRRFDNAVVCASFCRRFRPKGHELGVLAFFAFAKSLFCRWHLGIPKSKYWDSKFSNHTLSE